jgi:hypothetical protein
MLAARIASNAPRCLRNGSVSTPRARDGRHLSRGGALVERRESVVHRAPAAPVIWLPLSLLVQLLREQAALLAHELAHIARMDWLWNGLQCVLEFAVLPPRGWWLGRRIRQEREHACDDVVAVCGDAICWPKPRSAPRHRHTTPRLVLAAQGGSP